MCMFLFVCGVGRWAVVGGVSIGVCVHLVVSVCAGVGIDGCLEVGIWTVGGRFGTVHGSVHCIVVFLGVRKPGVEAAGVSV